MLAALMIFSFGALSARKSGGQLGLLLLIGIYIIPAIFAILPDLQKLLLATPMWMILEDPLETNITAEWTSNARIAMTCAVVEAGVFGVLLFRQLGKISKLVPARSV